MAEAAAQLSVPNHIAGVMLFVFVAMLAILALIGYGALGLSSELCPRERTWFAVDVLLALVWDLYIGSFLWRLYRQRRREFDEHPDDPELALQHLAASAEAEAKPSNAVLLALGGLTIGMFVYACLVFVPDLSLEHAVSGLHAPRDTQTLFELPLSQFKTKSPRQRLLEYTRAPVNPHAQADSAGAVADGLSMWAASPVREQALMAAPSRRLLQEILPWAAPPAAPSALSRCKTAHSLGFLLGIVLPAVALGCLLAKALHTCARRDAAGKKRPAATNAASSF